MRSIDFGGVDRAAQSAYDSFARFWTIGAAAGTAVTGLVGGLSSLVSGLYLVGTAAVSAASSLAAVGGVLGSLIQGGIAVGIAFRGVGEAIGLGFDAASEGADQSSASVIAAARRISDAQARIDEVRTRNAERTADAIDRVQDAERDLADAQRDARRAQDDLTNARKEAQEELQQLAFSAEDAALSEERAALRLEDAYEEMQAAAGLPADDRARLEAELAFKEADLGYRMAKDRASDLAEEQKRAAKAGVEGTETYTSALEQVEAANERAADAEAALAEAREDRSKVAEQNALDLAKAQQALERAYEDQTRALDEANSAARDYQDALDGLSDSASAFVQNLVDRKGDIEAFSGVVQEAFFQNFSGSFFTALDTVLKNLQVPLSATAAIMGQIGADLADFVNDNIGLFAEALDRGNSILQIFTQTGESGNGFFSDLAFILLKVWEAIGPLTTRFTEWITALADGAAVLLGTEEGLESLTGFFDRAGDRAAAFGDIFGGIFDLFGNLADAAGPAIDELLAYFNIAFDGMAGNAENNMAELTDFFLNVVDNLKPILELVGQLGLEFLKLGADESIGEAFSILADGRLRDSIVEIIDAFADSGPIFAELVVNVAEILGSLAESGSLEAFFGTLLSVAEVLNTVFANEQVQQVLAFVAPLLGFGKAIWALGKGVSFVGKVFKGALLAPLRLLGGLFTRVLTVVRPFLSFLGQFRVVGAIFGRILPIIARVRNIFLALRALFLVFSGPIGIIIGVITGLVLVFRHLYENNERFREVVDQVWSWVRRTIEGFVEWFRGIPEWFRETLSGLWDGITEGWNTMRETLSEAWASFVEWVQGIPTAVTDGLSHMWDVITDALQTAWDFLLSLWVGYWEFIFSIPGLVWDGLSTMWDVIADAVQWVWDRFLRGWGRIWEWITGLPGRVTEAISGMWNGLTEFLGNALDGAREMWNTFVEWVTELPGRIADGLRNLGNLIGQAIADGLNGLFGWIDDRVLSPLEEVINGFGGNVSLNMPTVRWNNFAAGGPVRGPGGPTDDKIPAKLSNGEFVMRTRAVRSLGSRNLEYMNKTGQLPPNSGGLGRIQLGGWTWDVPDPGDVLSSVLGKPLGWALDKIIGGAIGLIPNGLKEGTFFGEMIVGALEQLRETAKSWGEKEQDKKDKEAGRGGTRSAVHRSHQDIGLILSAIESLDDVPRSLQ